MMTRRNGGSSIVAQVLADPPSIADDETNKDVREEGLKPAPFAYAKARSLEHAVELLGRDGARVLAGGQSLIATLNMRLSRPRLLVDINALPGLDRLARRNGHIELGALVRHARAERSTQLAQAAPLIARALPHIG